MKNDKTAGCIGCGAVLLLMLVAFGGCVAFVGNKPQSTEPDPLVGISTLLGYDPNSPPPKLTPAQKYRADIAFWGAREALTLDADTIYNEIKPPLCEDLANAAIPVDTTEKTLSDAFRRNGMDEKQADKIAAAFIKVTTQPGQCD